jgi:FkbM family methyltransferase
LPIRVGRRTIVQNQDSGPHPLERVRYRKVSIKTVIDVGAAQGDFSRWARPFYPFAQYLLIEARPDHEDALRKACAEIPNARYVLAAAGPAPGEAHFFPGADALGGRVFDHAREQTAPIPMTSIDAEVARLNLPPPYYIKLDTHGFELEILAGAERTLAAASLLQLEVYNFEIWPGVPRFDEMIRRVHDLGFRPVDVFGPMHRRSDAALWQLDVLFEPLASPVFKSDKYE